MMLGRRLVAFGLVAALFVPEVALAGDGGAPWDEESPSPTDALLLQAAAHRVTGQAEGAGDANEHEIVAQVFDTYVALGIDSDSARQIAALQADSIEKAKTLKSTRRRRSFFRTLFRKVPVFNLVPKITDPLYRAIGPGGRSLVRGLEPDIKDVALGAFFGGGSVREALRALFRSRLKQVKRRLMEDTAARLLTRLQSDRQAGGTTMPASGEGEIRWDLTAEDLTSYDDPDFHPFGMFHWSAIHFDRGSSFDPSCQYLRLHINEVWITLVFDVAAQAIVSEFEGGGQEDYREPAGQGVERGNDASGAFAGSFTTTLTGTTAEGWPKFEGSGEVYVEISTTMYCDYWSDGEHVLKVWDEAGTHTGAARIQIIMIPEEDDLHFTLLIDIDSLFPPGAEDWIEEPAIRFGAYATGLVLPAEYQEFAP